MPPLVLVASAWGLGLLIARYWLVPFGIPPAVVALQCLLALGTALLWRKDATMRLAAACSLALLLSALRYEIHLPDLADPHTVAYFNGRGWVTVTGVVSGYPDKRDTWTLLRLKALAIETGGKTQTVQGNVLVRAARFPEYQYGDRLRISGLLKTPPELEGFSYRDYLARQGILSVLERTRIERVATGQGSAFWDILLAFKDRCRNAVAQLMRMPESSLLQGIVLGIRSEIPSAIYDEFNTTSTSHILVISGANIMIVTALLARVLGRTLGKRRAYWLTLVAILAYVLLVGGDAPVVRAGVMAGLYLTARHLGRSPTAYVSLFAAGVLLTAIHPMSLWDVSFQLTFAASLGLVLLTEPMEGLMEKSLLRRISNDTLRAAATRVGELLSVTLAPQVAVLPVLALGLGRLSLVGPLANILIAPAQPLIMTSGGIAMLLALPRPLLPLARLLAWLPWLLLAYTRTVIRWMAAWPWSFVPISHAASVWLTAGLFACLAIAWLIRHRQEAARGLSAWLSEKLPSRIGIGLTLIGLLLLSLTIVQLPDRRLHVAFLDVGQGDSVLITTPRGQQILVDGGPSPTALLTALGKEMPFWDHSIDLVVSTHADSDHLTGLVEVLQRYTVGGWIDNGLAGDDPLVQACLARLAQRRIQRRAVVAGDQLDLGEGIALGVLGPQSSSQAQARTDPNNNSVVLLLTQGSNRFLLTGDIEAETERLLLRSDQLLHAEVLKVAHHGSADSSTKEFLAAVDPAFAVVSVGAGNRSGLPSGETLDRLARPGDVLVLRTDEHGTIEFVSDGQQLQVHSQR